jgi:hypothetical protein
MADLSKGEIKIYEQNGCNQVEVIMQDNSIWLSADKIGELFNNKDRSTIQRHIKHIYEEDELSKDSTCAFFAQVQTEGNARDLLEEIRKERMSHGLDFANAKSGRCLC